MPRKSRIKIDLTLNGYLSFKNFRDMNPNEEAIHYIADRLGEVDERLPRIILESFKLKPKAFGKNMSNTWDLYEYMLNYEPSEVNKISILGENYYIPDKLNTMEAIEAKQILWLWSKKESEGQDAVNDMFSALCSLSAIILRTKGKPNTYAEFMAYVDKKTIMFFDYLGPDIAFSCLDKVIKTWDQLSKMRVNKWFFEPPKPKGDPDAIIELQKKNAELFNRVGYRSIYNRLNDSNAFQCEDKDTYTKNLEISRAIAQISQENSIC